MSKIYLEEDTFTGRQFGNWTVLSVINENKKAARMECQCICGIIKILEARYVLKASSSCCGKCRYKNARDFGRKKKAGEIVQINFDCQAVRYVMEENRKMAERKS